MNLKIVLLFAITACIGGFFFFNLALYTFASLPPDGTSNSSDYYIIPNYDLNDQCQGQSPPGWTPPTPDDTSGFCIYDNGSGGFTTNRNNAGTGPFSNRYVPTCASAYSSTDLLNSSNTSGICNTGGIFNLWGARARCCSRWQYLQTYSCIPDGTNNRYCTPRWQCPAGYTDVTGNYSCSPQANSCCQRCASYQSCVTGDTEYYAADGACGFHTCPAYCRDGASSCSACTGGASNTCGNIGSQTCQHDNTNGYTNCIWNGFSNNGCFRNSCSPGFSCPGSGSCQTTIYIHVYTDYNHDGIQNGGDSGIVVPVNLSTGGSGTTDASGNAGWGGQTTGSKTISFTVPVNYQVSTPPNPYTFTLSTSNPNPTITFGTTPLYAISGRVFQDNNKNQKYDTGEIGYGSGTIHITGPTAVTDMTAAADGTWSTPPTLLSGTYTVSYASALTPGFKFTTPSTFAVTVGNPAGAPVCNKGSSLDASCGGTNNGSVNGLDFGVTNNNPWNQSMCFDVRDDSGTYNDPIPAAPSCGGVTGAYNAITNASCTTGAGIIFTCDATPDFGLGSANANNWRAGGVATDQECFTNAGLNIIRTSYDYLKTTMQQSGITPLDMNQITVCGIGGIANCTLSSTLAKGIYLADGDLTLSPGSGTYTFPVDLNNPQGFIFLIHGNLTIQQNILVPAGSVAAFSASGNIYIDKTVGQVITTTSDSTNNTPNLEGLYSADANVVIQSYTSGTTTCNADGTPLDRKLNIVGSVVTNAAKAGGALLNNRDLCIYDTSCAAVSLGDSNGLALSYLLTMMADGKFLAHKVFNWEEKRP